MHIYRRYFFFVLLINKLCIKIRKLLITANIILSYMNFEVYVFNQLRTIKVLKHDYTWLLKHKDVSIARVIFTSKFMISKNTEFSQFWLNRALTIVKPISAKLLYINHTREVRFISMKCEISCVKAAFYDCIDKIGEQ